MRLAPSCPVCLRLDTLVSTPNLNSAHRRRETGGWGWRVVRGRETSTSLKETSKGWGGSKSTEIGMRRRGGVEEERIRMIETEVVEQAV